jgi:hypothetical protein
LLLLLLWRLFIEGRNKLSIGCNNNDDDDDDDDDDDADDDEVLLLLTKGAEINDGDEDLLSETWVK